MDFAEFRKANLFRQLEWPGAQNIDVAFRALEVGGEAGELLEAVKKYLRDVRGIAGSTATINDVAQEAADVIISVDLLCLALGIDLAEAISKKFNATSEKYGFATRLQEEKNAL